jgi:tetratricopeptide (TPR) repeat protein
MSSILITIALLFSDYTSLRRDSHVEYQRGHYPQAEVLILKSIEAAKSNHDDYAEAIGYSAFGDIMQAELRFSEAEREYRKALLTLNEDPKRSHAAAIVWRNLATALTGEGNYREALSALSRASKLLDASKVDDPDLNAEILNTFGVIHFQQGAFNKAEGFFSRAAALPVSSDRPDEIGLWQMQNNLAKVYQARHQYGKAEDAFKRALQLCETQLSPGNPSVVVLYDNLGALYLELGRIEEAQDQFLRGLGILARPASSFDDLALMHTLYQLARTCIAQNNQTRALPILERAATIARKRVAATEMPEISEILETYSKVLRDLSKPAEAEHVQSEARKVRAAMTFTVPVRSLQ